jgi:hypothetical protein
MKGFFFCGLQDYMATLYSERRELALHKSTKVLELRKRI